MQCYPLSGRLFVISTLIALACAGAARADGGIPLPAFPGAEGHGAAAIGGRGGRVIAVTRLDDDGVGSLRWALRSSGPRIIVFRVAGTIRLRDKLRIDEDRVTVAGQTAPGGGIVLRGSGRTLIQLRNGVSDVVLRYLRLRNGSGTADGSGADNITLNGARDVMLDHLSLSWSSDENVSLWRQTAAAPITRVSLQRSLIAEGLDGHSNGMIVGGFRDESGVEPVDNWRLISDISVHHNLFVHNSHRNPRVAAAGLRAINNVVYNWRVRIGSTTHGAVYDQINNFAKAGPMLARLLRLRPRAIATRLFTHEHLDPRSGEVYPPPSIYSSGNVVEPVHPDADADDWRLWTLGYGKVRAQPLPPDYRRARPLPPAAIPVTVTSARAAYRSVLADVGANARVDCDGRWLPNSDAVDVRLSTEVRNGTGPATPVTHPLAYPLVAAGEPCADADADGMPDRWERRYGFDAADAGDAAADADADGYTNIEEFLNGTTPRTASSARTRSGGARQ